jgi:hypothetical protein
MAAQGPAPPLSTAANGDPASRSASLRFVLEQAFDCRRFRDIELLKRNWADFETNVITTFHVLEPCRTIQRRQRLKGPELQTSGATPVVRAADVIKDRCRPIQPKPQLVDDPPPAAGLAADEPLPR